MGRTWTSKDAKNEIALIRSYLEELDYQIQLMEKYESEIRQEIEKRATKKARALCQNNSFHVFSDTEQAEIKELVAIPVIDEVYGFDNNHFVSMLSKYSQIQSMCRKSQNLKSQAEKLLREKLSDLQLARNEVVYFLASRAGKQRAEKAHEYLQYYLSSEAYQIVLRQKDIIELVEKQGLRESYQHYGSDPQEFSDIVLKFHHGTLDETKVYFPETLQSGELTGSLKTTREILNTAERGSEEKDKLEGQIINLATQVAKEQALGRLNDIPIEELNREKRGFRIKTLRDAGYHSIGDIVVASPYELSSIYGITLDTAFSMKRVAEEIQSQAVKNVKIRISVDNKTKRTTQLIRAISQYRGGSEFFSTCAEIRKHKESIENTFRSAEIASDCMKWLKASEHQHSESLKDVRTIVSYNHRYDSRVRNQQFDYSEKRLTDEGAWRDFEENSVAFFSVLESLVPGILGNDDSYYGLPEDLAKEIQEECFFPNGLLCTLRRYQEWGVKYILHQERVLLGDEMGLGKTIQAIAVMVSLKNTGANFFMVVCPASVLINWQKEIRKHSKLSVTVIHGYNRMGALRSWLARGGVAVTTFDTVGSLDIPEKFHIDQIIVDEAHYIKNEKAIRTKNVAALCEKSSRVLFMTGTALENNVDEMISLIKKLQPEIALRIETMKVLVRAPEFRNAVAPVYYRRKREDVLTELPDKTEVEEWCQMNSEEREKYEDTVFDKNFMAMRRVSWNALDIHKSSKAIRMMELIEEAKSEGRKIIVFSYFLDTIARIQMLLGTACVKPINGSVSPIERQRIIDDFEKAGPGTVLPAQIQSGGTGLNIQSASVVIICEPQLKPSIEQQAISRAYRLGQTRKVLVYRLLCSHSVDERVMEILKEKQQIFNAFADESVAAEEVKSIDNKTVDNIIQEEIDRINNERNGRGIE